MVATNLKAETMAMMERRSSLESEMNAIIAHLCAPGGPGISGNLVDSEGFPRPDIDVPSVRSQRSRLAALHNDYKVLTAKIDENLQVLHSARLTKGLPLSMESSDVSASPHTATSQVSPMHEDLVVKIPFAMVDEITDDSPAAEDGLQLGDQIIKFGNVEMGDEVVHRLASEARSNEGHPIPIIIMREGSQMNLTITPRQWHGRGLLGCHFRIL
ncbi:uncharacterized protein A4U43_C05F17600 [Asparagus officinalis]|uniref:PDZ domain-containing protein n=1 Tax=Asparagus officinalis TaxID=4686 RepID=A0A5P1ESB0_ASPOF|nr:26S proteasome non-ATPase regulatory subunit 9 [Asparagus officinalis]ONK68938.1 uncharacterized protein A4U43_C05F17600 [Asparagus officinalis]